MRLSGFPDPAARDRLQEIPTAYALSKDQLEDILAAGHVLLEADPEFQRLLRDIPRF